jgi:F-type H+-transporting ATPase subunit b
MELLHSLGIDWRLLGAQIINFLILLAILYRFLYKPILRLMQERENRIKESLKNAEETEKKLASTTQEYEKKMIEARRQAQSIMEATNKEAATLKAILLAQAQKDADQIITEGKARLNLEKEEIMREAKSDLALLVVEAARSVLGKVVNKDIDQQIIAETAKHLKI